MKTIKLMAMAALFAIGFVACLKNTMKEKPVASKSNWKSNAVVIDKNANVEGIGGSLYRTESGQLIMEASSVENRLEEKSKYTGTWRTLGTKMICDGEAKNCKFSQIDGDVVIVIKYEL